MSGILDFSVVPIDVQKLSVSKEEPPEEQDWSPSQDQEESEHPPFKEEQEELWISQDGEQLEGHEEEDVKFPCSPVVVKTEGDEEKPESFQLHEIKTEEMETGDDGEDCEGSEEARSSDAERYLHPEIEVKIEESSESETEDCNDVMCSAMHQSDLKSVEREEDKGSPQAHLEQHTLIHIVEKPLSCPECGKGFSHKGNLTDHLRTHTGEKPYSCSECGKRYRHINHLKDHLKTHTGEKPFSCPDCDKSFKRKRHLRDHLRTHSGEKPFSCSECGKRFNRKAYLTIHMIVHTKEKPLSCSECDKRFAYKGSLRKHMMVHTGERPFSCSECTKTFKVKENFNNHMLKRHKCVGSDYASMQLKKQTKIKRKTETGADVEDCGGSEGARNSDPGGHLQPEIEVIIEDFSEHETEDFHEDS
ncbi:zinc finger protein 664-like [Cheilinus undulatus]|uniref:zinc finger protein 664-like n=1 Tax=Cheilinus undulatus TaxID=241271 RepID=UPI001BD1F3F8|nr:zinc finger protein 664-like [Cheilinus undulatus]